MTDDPLWTIRDSAAYIEDAEVRADLLAAADVCQSLVKAAAGLIERGEGSMYLSNEGEPPVTYWYRLRVALAPFVPMEEQT